MAVYGMITTSRSHAYTPVALASFLRTTRLENSDRCILIDNDANYDRPGSERFELWRNAQPMSFAQNMNRILDIAIATNQDAYLLNNDLVFTSDWDSPLKMSELAIVSPLTNAELSYKCDGVQFSSLMSLEEYIGHEQTLEKLAVAHRTRVTGFKEVLTLPFACIRIPREILGAVGRFDESFGLGGAEDRDYCIRAILAGFRIRYAMQSYILHFQGRSTWRGGESETETRERDEKYSIRFREKWGDDLFRIFIGLDSTVIAERGLEAQAAAGDFKGILEALKKGK